MCKKFFLLSAFVFFYDLASAQIEVGIKLGSNVAKSVFDDEGYNRFNTSKYSIGFQGGFIFVMENPKNDKYALQTELYYSQIGRKVESSNRHDFTTNTAKYHYLHLPVMFRMRFKTQAFDWYLILGPQVSYWLGGKGVYEVLDASRDVINSYNYRINFGEPLMEDDKMNITDANRIQIGLNIGLGWYHELNDTDRIAAGIRYYFGHSYMGEYDGGEIPFLGRYDNFESINQWLELSVFYAFDIYQKTRVIRKKRY